MKSGAGASLFLYIKYLHLRIINTHKTIDMRIKKAYNNSVIRR